MTRDDIQKLLGGYATGTLTPAEQQALFEAALDDQELFDALAREQSLRDLLRDPAAKVQLLAALEERPARWYQRLAWRPAAAVLAMAGVAVLAVVVLRHGERRPQQVLLSEAGKPPALPAAPALVNSPDSTPRTIAQPATKRPKVVVRQFDSPVAAPKPTEVPPPAIADLKKAEAPPVSVPTAAPPPPLGARAGGGGGGAGGGIGGFMPTLPQQQMQQMQQMQQGQQGQQRQQSQSFLPPDPGSTSITVESAAPLLAIATAPGARALFYSAAGVPQPLAAPAGMAGAANSMVRTSRKQAAAQAGGRGGRGSAETQGKLEQQSVNGNLATTSTGRADTAVAPAVNPGIRYRISRQIADGQFVATDPDSLKTGDVIRLELTANLEGTLTVRGNAGNQVILSQPAEPMQSYATPSISPSEKELQVTFVRRAVGLVAGTGAAAALSLGAVNTPGNAVESFPQDRATYVVAMPNMQQLQFTIPLKYQ